MWTRSTHLASTTWHDPMSDFANILKAEATETPEEGPLAFLWAEGGVWMTRRSGDATAPKPLASVLSLVYSCFLRSRPVVPNGGEGS